MDVTSCLNGIFDDCNIYKGVFSFIHIIFKGRKDIE